MFSPNMLKTYQSCPQKYWFKYVQKISVPQKSSLFEKGKKIHALAHYYLRGDDISKLEKDLNAEEKEVWESLKQNEYFQKSYVNSEYNISCKVGDYWIGGRIDAIVKDTPTPAPSPIGRGESTYYILDYKTGQIPKNPEYDFQTAVYLLCLLKKLEKSNEITTPLSSTRNDMSLRANEVSVAIASNIKFVYIDLKNNQNCVIDFDKDYINLITDICEKCENIQLQENIEYSKQCEFCEYRKLCF